MAKPIVQSLRDYLLLMLHNFADRENRLDCKFYQSISRIYKSRTPTDLADQLIDINVINVLLVFWRGYLEQSIDDSIYRILFRMRIQRALMLSGSTFFQPEAISCAAQPNLNKEGYVGLAALAVEATEKPKSRLRQTKI